MRSAIGSLGWVARQCHPDLSYDVSRGQSVVSQAKLRDFKQANQAIEQAKEFADVGVIYHHDAINWDSVIVVTITDASFAQETVIEANGIEKPHRTQKEFAVLLVDPAIVKEKEAGAHLWTWKSLTDKRVRRATLQGEAHGLLSGADAGDRLRAIICDVKGHLMDMREWQRVCSENMRHIWLSDCELLVSHLKNPKNERLENVRLSIGIQSLKQMLWEKADVANLDELLPEDVCENAIRWIGTSCVLVDSSTKKMNPDVLIKLMQTGRLNLEAPVQSQMLKLRKS